MPDTRHDYWGRLDQPFTVLRRKLFADPTWRLGPRRVHQIAKRVHDNLAARGSIVGLRFADIGAGCHNPFGTSAVLYLNGISFAVACDASPTDERRAAEALYDLLVACLIEPDVWHWAELPRERFLGNIRRFDLPALRDGNLEAGLAHVPIRHLVCDLQHTGLAAGSIDLMSSQAVMEHFLDYRKVLKSLYDLMAPGGRGFHHVDLRDHRAYPDPEHYHALSFLTEGDEWSDGLCNRLRLCDFERELPLAGFDLDILDTQRVPLPPGFRSELRGRFSLMTDEQLEVQSFDCLVSKS